MNKLIDLYEKGDMSPRISNSVLESILNTNEITGTVSQRAFAYCYLGIVSYLLINSKYSKHTITVMDIKGFLGYSEINKKIDYIIKKNGVLYKLGYLTDEKNIFNLNANRIRVPIILDEMDDCHTFNLKLFFDCMDNEELGINGFVIANYLKEFGHNYSYGEWGSIVKLSNILNIEQRTLCNYLKILNEYNLIEKVEIRRKDEHISDISVFLRSKLGDWIENSIKENDKKCFVSGREDNLTVHHVVSFTKIRNFVLDSLNIETKPISEFSKEELDATLAIFLDYHKLSIGIPLNKEVHSEFHKEYGDYASLEDLLRFKYKNLLTN